VPRRPADPVETPGLPPPGAALRTLRRAAATCRACPLWEPATQTVFGEGPATARIVLVGEVPGDEEDLSGHPFVGPAGQLLDKALAELGLDREAMYVTNAVKHFKFVPRGKRRLHSKPSPSEQRACRPWLEREFEAIRPQVIVCLGATAAQAVLGRGFGLMKARGQWTELGNGARVLATVHPSWVLRQRGSEARAAAYAGFVADLSKLAAE
jgi:uracil-DNA glycosylase